MKDVLKIITRGAGADNVPTQGTRVCVGGVELKNVLRVEVVASLDDFWTAHVTVAINPARDIVSAEEAGLNQ